MFGLGTTELLLIVLAIFILFGGGKKIPELFAGMGKGIRTFKKSLNEDDPDDTKELSEEGKASEASQQSQEQKQS